MTVELETERLILRPLKLGGCGSDPEAVSALGDREVFECGGSVAVSGGWGVRVLPGCFAAGGAAWGRVALDAAAEGVAQTAYWRDRADSR